MTTAEGGFAVCARFIIEAKYGRRWMPLGDEEHAWMFETAKERDEKLAALRSETPNGIELRNAP